MSSQHEKKPLRVDEYESDSRVTDAGPGSRDPDSGLRRGIPGSDGQLPNAGAGVGTGVAVELTGCAYAVAAGDCDASRTGTQAGAAGAVDSVPDDGGVSRGRSAA